MDPMRIAVIDDDPFVAAHLRIALAERLPEAELYTSEQAVAPAGYDVYIIDNDFGGLHRGGELHDRVRAVAPDALVLAYSAELDTGFLRRLMRGGARDVYDKSSAADREALLLAIVDEHRARSGSRGRRRGRSPSAIAAVADLLREWNRRLEGPGASEPGA